MKTRKNSKTSKPKFSNRTRFNWGYHDAAQTVRKGWDTEERNFGFCKGTLKITCVRDVLVQHFDKAYAQGWQAGYNDAKDGMYEGDSEAAWNRAKFLSLVSD